MEKPRRQVLSWNWRAGSTVKNTVCSSREPGVQFAEPPWHLATSVASVSRDPVSSFNLYRHQAHMVMQVRCSYS